MRCCGWSWLRSYVRVIAQTKYIVIWVLATAAGITCQHRTRRQLPLHVCGVLSCHDSVEEEARVHHESRDTSRFALSMQQVSGRGRTAESERYIHLIYIWLDGVVSCRRPLAASLFETHLWRRVEASCGGVE